MIAFPVGVAAAVYLEEYASDNRITRIIGSNIRNLAGVPSIVYGILGLFLFVDIFMGGILAPRQGIGGRNVIAGGLTLAVLVLPIMIITTSEALRAVPGGLREASLAVGATRWETIRHHVLPVAFPAILTGSVLTIARAFGESAALLLAGAQLSLYFSVANDASFVDLIANQPYTALPIIIFNFARQPQAEFVALTAAAIVVSAGHAVDGERSCSPHSRPLRAEIPMKHQEGDDLTTNTDTTSIESATEAAIEEQAARVARAAETTDSPRPTAI